MSEKKRIRWNLGAARTGYGREVYDNCGASCAYCGQDLNKSYELWINITVDHVIPYEDAKKKWGKVLEPWLDNYVNTVTCCRACNEFLNQYIVEEKKPETHKEFFKIRDKIFLEKKEMALKRHNEEKKFYEKWKKEYDEKAR